MTFKEAVILYHYQKLIENKATMDSDPTVAVTAGAIICYEQYDVLADIMMAAIDSASYVVDQGKKLAEQQ